MKVGIVGAGAMGRPMALNLLRGGHQLVAYDKQPEALATLLAAGIGSAESPGEVARESDVVFTSLPSLKAVEAVFLGEDGLVPSARPGQTLIDLSTVLPSLARRIHDLARERGVDTLDAPVSGGTHGAKDATLSVMVGGDREVFERVTGLLGLIGTNLYYVGPSGSGSRIKLINQLLVAVNNVAAVEALALASRGGMDVATVREIVSVSAGDSRVFEIAARRIHDGDFEDGASIDILSKDSELVLSLAEEMGAYVPMLRLAREMYFQGQGAGIGGKDMAALVRLFERT